MTQPSLLDLAPVVEPQPSPVAREKARLSANALRVLARLQEGPASNQELVEVGGHRAVGRCWDLQRDGWDIRKQHAGGGKWIYTLHGYK